MAFILCCEICLKALPPKERYHFKVHLCEKCKAKKYRKDPRKRILIGVKARAKQHGLVFNLEVHDLDPLPKTCPYLGCNLDYRHPEDRGTRRAWNAPSIDRIDNTKGYTPDNIQIISDLANRMKQDASLTQLVNFSIGVLREHAPSLLK